MFWQAADGTGSAERLTTSPHVQTPWTFTPDGKSLVLRDTDPKNGFDISLMGLEGDRVVKPLLHSTQLNVVLNWGEELKRLAPVKR